MMVVRWNMAEDESSIDDKALCLWMLSWFKTGDGNDDLNLLQDDEQPHGGYPNAIVEIRNWYPNLVRNSASASHSSSSSLQQ